MFHSFISFMFFNCKCFPSILLLYNELDILNRNSLNGLHTFGTGLLARSLINLYNYLDI